MFANINLKLVKFMCQIHEKCLWCKNSISKVHIDSLLDLKYSIELHCAYKIKKT